MKLGVLKNVMRTNNITNIQIRSLHTKVILSIVDALFDQNTRTAIYLKATSKPMPRTNKYNSIKSYLLDFKDTHTVYVEVLSKNNSIYTLDSLFEIDNKTHTLYLTCE